MQTTNRGLQVQVSQLTKEKTKCEEDIKKFEGENSNLIKNQREMRNQIMQYQKGLSQLDNLERMYKDIKIQMEQYKAEKTRLSKENQAQDKQIQNLREELNDIRMREQLKKAEQDQQLHQQQMKQQEVRGLRLDELDIPLDEDGHEQIILDDDLESRIVEVLKKEIMPDLSDVEGAALRRYIQSANAIKEVNHDLNERLQAFDDDNKVRIFIYRNDEQKLYEENEKLQEEMENFKQSSITYKAQVGFLQDRIRRLEEEETGLRNVSQSCLIF